MTGDYIYIIYSGTTHQPITLYECHMAALSVSEKLNTTAKDLSFSYVLALHRADYHHLHRNNS